MPLLELALRVATFTQLAVVTLVLLWYPGRFRSYRAAALLFAGIGGYLLAPIAVDFWQWNSVAYAVVLLANLVPVFFWYFCCTVFDDGFSLSPLLKGLIALSTMVALLGACSAAECPLSQQGALSSVAHWSSQLMKFLWTAAAFVAVVHDRIADLVEPRRRLRRFILFGGGCYILVILVVELFIDGPAPSALEVFNLSMMLAGVTALSLHLLAPAGDNLFARLTPAPAPAGPARSDLANRVVAAMETERGYAEEVTIDSLALHLDTQPHQLRRVINGELGFRNFNAFINRYRVQEVARRLGQSEYADSPFLTLALDAGFRSIAPFNRAFKAEYGVTPTDYRRALAARDPS